MRPVSKSLRPGVEFALACVLACALVAVSVPVVPATAAGPPPPAEQADAHGDSLSEWAAPAGVDRLLTRFFGRKKPSGEDLEGRAVSAVDRFAGDAGKHIEVVLVHPVTALAPEGDQAAARRLLSTLTRPLRSYTADGVVRDFLLFERGQEVDPYLLADSERLLRLQEFIGDVRINVVPLTDAGDTVAVVVQTTDKWPLGVDARVEDTDEFRASVFSVNLRGQGVGLEGEFLYREPGDPPSGGRVLLDKRNLVGSFWDLELEAEDSHVEKQMRVMAERRLVHPGINVVGGTAVQRVDDRREHTLPNGVTQGEVWAGRVQRLYDRRDADLGSRPLIVPAVRFVNRAYRFRPVVTPDSNRSYHESRMYLAGLTFQSLRYYKTSFLLGLGETESVPEGVVAKVTGGYQDGEYSRRSCLFLYTAGSKIRGRGDILYGTAEWGGFLRNRRIEDGIFRIETGYYSALRKTGRYRKRHSVRLAYTRGIRRSAGDYLMLRPEEGLRILPEEEVIGNQRFTSLLETTVFTPWSLAGFRVSCFAEVDAGVIGTEKAALLREKIYYGLGVGVNLRNPDLALPTWRIHVALRNQVEDHSPEFVISLKSIGVPVPGFAGAKPSLPVYR